MTGALLLFYLAALALTARGISLLRNRDATPQLRAFSGATLVAVLIALLIQLSIARGMLVISPEFGIVMVQGGWLARHGLSAVLLGISVAAGLCWHATRLQLGRAHRGKQILAVGLLFGLAAAWSVQPLNKNEAEALQIHRYDLGWPPLQLWLVVSVVASVFAERKLGSTLARIAVIAVFVALFTALPFLRPPSIVVLTNELWKYAAWVAWPAAWAVAGALALRRPLQSEGRPPAAVVFGVALASALFGATACWFFLSKPAELPMPTSWAPAAVLAGPLLLAAIRWRVVWPVLSAGQGGMDWRDFGVLASIVLIAASLAALFYVTTLPAAVALTIFLASWMVLAELLFARSTAAAESGTAAGGLKAIGLHVRTGSASVLAFAQGLAQRAGALIAAALSASSIAVALLKAAVGVLLLVALSEIPNAGRTVVLPFQTPEVEPFKGSGQALADHVVASMARLNEELLPDLIVLKDLKPKDAKAGSATSQGANTLDATLKKDVDIEFGGVKIPLGALVAPVQAPMRAMLGVRVISGSVHLNRDAHTLLASSTAGESWQVRLPCAGTDCALLRPAPAATPAPVPAGAAGASAAAARQTTAQLAPVATPGYLAADVFAPLADELAFYIRRDDTRVASPGMTRSWEAFKFFRDGLRHWRRFELTNGYEALEDAARGFRAAIQVDPAFALAHYRLGLVMQNDGQPAQAVEALRASLRVSPGFLPASVALAATLWDFESFLFHEVVALDADPGRGPGDAAEAGVNSIDDGKTSVDAREFEARVIWQGLVRTAATDFSPVDRAAANYGLCALARRSFVEAKPAGKPDALLGAYFHCKRSEGLYQRLPADRRTEPQVVRGEGWVLRALGTLMMGSGEPFHERIAPGWRCYPDKPDASYRRGPYTHLALSYFERALPALRDEADVLCEHAQVAAALGDDAPMNALRMSLPAGVNLAYRFDEESDKSRALQEFARLIRTAPEDVEALNGFAYVVTGMASQAANDADAKLPDIADLLQAETHARKAVALTADWVDPTPRIKARSTLGEVLLTQGRYHEAVEHFEETLEKLGKAGQHVVFHRLRYDLARAALCAAEVDERAGNQAEAVKLNQRALQMRLEISTSERKRALPIYSDPTGAPDGMQLPPLCERRKQADRAADAQASHHVNPAVQTGNHPVCGPQWVKAVVAGGDMKELKLELWGGGVRRQFDLDDAGRTEALVLMEERKASRHRYYAILTRAERPASDRVWLTTSAATPDGTCPNNLLTVKFEPGPPAAASPRK